MIRVLMAVAAVILSSAPAMANWGTPYSSRTTGGYQSFSDITVQHNYALVQSAVMNIARQFPQTTQVFELGQSGTGEAIVGLRIGNGPIHNLIVSIHHGNEYGAAEVALSAAADLAANPIPNQTIFLIPVLNVSGFNADRREETVVRNGFRTNATQDANRDYPGPCVQGTPFSLQSTKALAYFIGANNIIASATLHTYMPGVLYPWGISTRNTSTAYDAQFIALANAATSTSHYLVGNSTQALYPADGAFEDFAFWQYGIWSLLFEVGTTHSPNKAELDELDRVNVPGLRAMMMNAPTVRAPDHLFHGSCDARMRMMDRRNE